MEDQPSIPVKKAISPKKQHVARILLLLMLCLGLGFLGGKLGSNNTLENKTVSQAKQIVSSEGDVIADIAKNVGPSVVSVNVTSTATINSFFGTQTAEQESAGTGIILSAEGIVMTNRHVVDETTTSVSVTLSDGTDLPATVLGRDTLNDIAFLKISDKKGKTLTPAKLGDSSKLRVGEKVVAIGNARGQFQNTVTSGIISGVGREIEASDGSGANSETLSNLLQTDAAINSGNSGGPLVNLSGEVIGLNVARGSDSDNLGFAIPINDTKSLVTSVLEKGKLERPYLGVRYVSLTDDYAYEYNLDVKRGAYIVPQLDGESASVVEGSPAAKAGLKEKDIITKVDKDAVNESNSLTALLGKHAVGDKVELTIKRDGKELKVFVTLEAAPVQ